MCALALTAHESPARPDRCIACMGRALLLVPLAWLLGGVHRKHPFQFRSIADHLCRSWRLEPHLPLAESALHAGCMHVLMRAVAAALI